MGNFLEALVIMLVVTAAYYSRFLFSLFLILFSFCWKATSNLKISSVLVLRAHINPFVMGFEEDLNELSRSQCGRSEGFMCMKNMCRRNEGAHGQCTWSAWGWGVFGEGRSNSWPKELGTYLQERILTINLELWIDFGYVESKERGKAFKSEGLKGQRRELSPGAQLPCSSLSQWEAAGNEIFRH